MTTELEPSGAGTKLTMIEDPAGKLVPLRLLPSVQALLRLRNVRSLRKLREHVESRTRAAAARSGS